MNAIKKIFLLILFFSFFIEADHKVHIFKLDNGLTLLVRQVKNLQKVALRLIFNVGSTSEETGQAGYAHWLEHMLFKGASKDGQMILSETDVGALENMLLGQTNAYTNYYYTNYLFNLPVEYLDHAFFTFAQFMQNATIDQDHLNSELKTVVQELKQRKDDFVGTLFEKMISMIFADHPCHKPVIGYKHDLFAMNRNGLISFYKKHYVPNNAALVVVGDVDPKEIFEKTVSYFGNILPSQTYIKPSFYFTNDIAAQHVKIYRDVQTPQMALAYVIPGFNQGKHHIVELLRQLLTEGKTSLLHKKLVDELKVVLHINSFAVELDEHDLFFIFFSPKEESLIPTILEKINETLKSIAEGTFDSARVHQCCKQLKTGILDLYEQNDGQADTISRSYISLNDPEHIFRNLWDDEVLLCRKMIEFVQLYLRPTVMHTGMLLPLPQEEKPFSIYLQNQSDQEDTQILAGKERITPVQEPYYAKKITVQEYKSTSFPKPETFELSNGLKVHYYHNAEIPKIEALIRLKADGDYDSIEKAGLYKMTCMMLIEGGTKNYSSQQLAEEFEKEAIGFEIQPGSIQLSMLKGDLGRAFELCTEVLSNPTFDENELEKVRAQALYHYKLFTDNPHAIAHDIINNYFYKNHPYSKNIRGTPETLNSITKEDLISFHERYFSPTEANLFIVGDLAGFDLKAILEKSLASWKSRPVESITYPELETPRMEIINHSIERDQTVLCFAGPSITRNHPDFYKLVLFDHIFGQSMQSRLFMLRQQTGIFYGISGSVLINTDNQPGTWRVQTMVSNDRLQEAEHLILNTIKTAADSITQEEVEIARRNVLEIARDFYATNRNIVNTLSALKFHDLHWTYFEEQYDRLKDISVDDVKNAAKNLLNPDSMLTVRVGRV